MILRAVLLVAHEAILVEVGDQSRIVALLKQVFDQAWQFVNRSSSDLFTEEMLQEFIEGQSGQAFTGSNQSSMQ